MDKEFQIYSYDENRNISEMRNWPVVYLFEHDRSKGIKSKNELFYVGETTSFKNRIAQHSGIRSKGDIKNAVVISHSRANKSFTYNLETKLLNLAQSDFFLKNSNFILSNIKKQDYEANVSSHYYNKEEYYDKQIEIIWEELINSKLTPFTTSYKDITVSDIWKESPYKNLSQHQSWVLGEIILGISMNCTSFIKGEAGTGKSLLVKRLVLECSQLANEDKKILVISKSEHNGNVLRDSLKFLDPNIFKNIDFMGRMLKESELVDKDDWGNRVKKYRHIIIDEGQLLSNSNFNNINKEDFMNYDYKNEYEYLSKELGYSLTVFYDPNQETKRSSVGIERFVTEEEGQKFELTEHFRINSYDNLTNFIEVLFDKDGCGDLNSFEFDLGKYEIEIADSPSEVWKYVKEKNKNRDLKKEGYIARIASTLSYCKWKSMDVSAKRRKEDKEGKYDEFLLDGEKLYWNDRVKKNWIQNPSTEYEVGSHFKLQGRSIEYLGLIITNEVGWKNGIKYDPDKLKNINSNFFVGIKGKEKAVMYNIYYTLLTRATKGMKIYLEDQNLKGRLKVMLEKSERTKRDNPNWQ